MSSALVTVSALAIGWLADSSTNKAKITTNGGIELTAPVASGEEIMTIEKDNLLLPDYEAQGSTLIDKLVLKIHNMKDAYIESQLDEYLEPEDSLRTLTSKKVVKPFPSHAHVVLKKKYARWLSDFTELPAQESEISQSRYLQIRHYIDANSWVSSGVPVLIPSLSSKYVHSDVASIIFNSDSSSVTVSSLKDVDAGVSWDQLPHRSGIDLLLKYGSVGDLSADCFPISLKERWGEKSLPIMLPETLCVTKSITEVPEQLAMAIAIGTMSDAKFNSGCAKKENVRGMFDCVGTEDFEKRVWKKGNVLLKNEIGRTIGDADIAKKLEAYPHLTSYVSSQKEILTNLADLFSSALDNIDANHYAVLKAEEQLRAKAEKEKKKEEKKEKDKKKDDKKKKKKKKDDKKKDDKKKE